MALLTYARAHERPRLNERPIFLRSTFYILALIQSFLHLYYDYDRLSIPETNRAAGSTSPNAPNRLGSPLEQLKTTLPRRIQAAFLRSLSMIVIGPVVYTTFMRKYAWSWTLYFAKVFRSLPRSSSMLPTIPPFSISMLFRSFTSTFALLLLWELSSTTFSAFTAQIPLKNDRPLTDGSKDPNGTLLIGLRAKRDLPRVREINLLLSGNADFDTSCLPSGSSPISAKMFPTGERPYLRTSIAREERHGLRSSTSTLMSCKASTLESQPSSTPLNPRRRQSNRLRNRIHSRSHA